MIERDDAAERWVVLRRANCIAEGRTDYTIDALEEILSNAVVVTCNGHEQSDLNNNWSVVHLIKFRGRR